MTSRVDCELPSVQQVVGDTSDAIRRRVAELCSLPANWDNAGASQLNAKSAANALTVALKVSCPECLPPVLSPTRAGNVLIDWSWGSECVELEVFPDGRIEGLVRLGPESTEFETSLDNDDHILQWIAHQVTGVGISRISKPTAS